MNSNYILNFYQQINQLQSAMVDINNDVNEKKQRITDILDNLNNLTYSIESGGKHISEQSTKLISLFMHPISGQKRKPLSVPTWVIKAMPIVNISGRLPKRGCLAV